MKRFFAIVFTVLLLLAMPFNVSVFAASGTYDLDELELQVTIPTGYSVITRDTPASDSIFSDLGTTKSAVISQFESSNIYLNAISDTYNEEVVVTMMENSLTNFSLLSDTELKTLASALVNQYTDYGINVSRYDIYQHSQAKFVRLHFTDTGKTVHGVQYYTIYNGKAMNFTMRSYEGYLSSRQETTVKNIVDSIQYDKAPPVSDPSEDTQSFIYTDTDSGVKFTVPANWKQEEFTKDQEYLDVKFVSTKENSCVIIFSSTDIWEQMSAFEKIGSTRSDLNNHTFTESDIAEMYGANTEKITTVTYNGIQYFKIEDDYTSDTYGMDITVTMTHLVYIDNGWGYMFQFGGASTHELYSEFESLIKSVQYPNVSNVGGFGSANDINSGTSNDTNDGSGIIAVVVLLVMVAIIVVVVVTSRKKNISSATPINSNLINNKPTPELSKETEPTIYCTKCGQALPLDSDFCHKCGNEIVKE